MERSILDLSTDELLNVHQTGVLPDGVSLAGIEERKDFDILYRHRGNPSLIAEILLKNTKNKAKGRMSPEEAEKRVSLAQDRVSLKQKELELKKEKVKGQTFLLKDLKTHLTRIETKLDLLIEESFKNKQEKTGG